MPPPHLSDRQSKIAALVAAGYCNREIAKQLNLSEQVVKNIIHSLFDKLGVWNRVELANHFANGHSTEFVENALQKIEAHRLEELDRRKILDTSAERIYDEVAFLAANIFRVPIALVAFVDLNRVWFKSTIGIVAADVPREITICNHTIQQSRVFIVNDAVQDARFQCSPLITADPEVRFYAGAPILTDDGYALGVVCIVDRVPREFEPSQIAVLESLARIVLEQTELRAKLATTDAPALQATLPEPSGLIS